MGSSGVASRADWSGWTGKRVIVTGGAGFLGRFVCESLRRRGVLATVNSDDPGMMRFDIADEYVAVAAAYGYTLEQMEQISLDGIEASWMADADKAAMRGSFLTEFDALRAEFGLAPRS